MRRERGDGFDKGDVALVRTSQKHSSSKKNVRNKSQDVCNYYKKKGHWAKEHSKRKKEKKSKKLEKKIEL